MATDVGFTTRYYLRNGAELSAEDAERILEDAPSYEPIPYRVRATCDEDGSAVSVSNVGTARSAKCRNGHRWSWLFDAAGTWRRLN